MRQRGSQRRRRRAPRGSSHWRDPRTSSPCAPPPPPHRTCPLQHSNGQLPPSMSTVVRTAAAAANAAEPESPPGRDGPLTTNSDQAAWAATCRISRLCSGAPRMCVSGMPLTCGNAEPDAPPITSGVAGGQLCCQRPVGSAALRAAASDLPGCCRAMASTSHWRVRFVVWERPSGGVPARRIASGTRFGSVEMHGSGVRMMRFGFAGVPAQGGPF